MNPCPNGGGFSFLATCIIQCMDIIKVHIKWCPSSTNNVEKDMFTYEGFGNFYKWLSIGLLRHSIYTITTRLRAFRAILLSRVTQYVLLFIKGDVAIVEDPPNENNGDDLFEEITISTF